MSIFTVRTYPKEQISKEQAATARFNAAIWEINAAAKAARSLGLEVYVRGDFGSDSFKSTVEVTKRLA